MGVRGRASSKQLSTRTIHAVQRPEPPERLSSAEAEVWRRTTCGLVADWFPPETLDLLECYCTHVIRKRELAEEIRDPRTTKAEIRTLSKLESEQTHLILLLASKMRLTQRSSKPETKNKHRGVVPVEVTGGSKPWAEDDDAEEAA